MMADTFVSAIVLRQAQKRKKAVRNGMEIRNPQ